MKKIGWLFPPRNGGNETGYTNQGIEGFKGEDLIDNLTREICQNSLDAGREISDAPVEVKFDLVNLEKSKYPIFEEFAECIEGCKQYWGSRMDDKLKMFVSGAEETLSKEHVTMLIASDSNTSGLTGVNATRDQKSVWRGLVQSDGASVKDGDSAGSYGIGKNAPFACSSLSMVLYNTYAVDEVRAFQGVARVATLIQNGKSTQSIGHYKVIDDEIIDEDVATPVTPDDKNCLIRDVFNRMEYGTDVGIVGFNAYDNWEDNIIKAILKNFFLAVIEEKLIVKVKDLEINKSNIDAIFQKYLDDKKVAISYEMYSAVISPDEGKIYEQGILNENVKDIEMYLKVDSSYNRNIGNFRNTGMLVGQCRKNTLQRFSAVVVVRGKKLGTLLKDAEPAKHNKWDANIINDAKRKKEARDAINKINTWIEKVLNERFAIPMDKAVDSDMGEYLPYEMGDVVVGAGSEGTDKLKVKQKISEVKPIPITAKTTDVGERTAGNRKDGTPGNSTRNPNPKPGESGRVDPDDTGEAKGTGKGSGNKTISFPKVLGQRVTPRSYRQGIYHGVFKLEKDSDSIYLQFSTVDADYKQDGIKVLNYVVNGERHKNVNAQKIGPISANKNEYTDISLVFDCSEKVVIKMTVSEER